MSYRKFILFCLIVMGSDVLVAQNFTNKGRDFWLCFPSHVPNQRNGVYYYAKMSVFITSDKSSSGKISVPGLFSSNFSVAAGAVTEVDIPYNIAHITSAEAGSVVRKGIRVLVDSGKSPVVVYAHIYAGFRSAASLVLPVAVLGKKYYSMNALQKGIDGSRSQFVIVAPYSNTVVKITPVKNGVKGQSFTVNLPAAGDVYELQDAEDLSGTLIESIPSGNDICKKIAVFSGSSAINISTSSACITNDSYDPLYQQLYPVNAWGKKYGLIPFENYLSGNPYRILASENNTKVQIDGSIVASLNEGEYYPDNSSFGKLQKTATLITADKPISVAQYAQSSACSGAPILSGKGYGDADMVMLNPVEQNVNNITVFSSQKENIYSDAKFINVLIPKNALTSFKINNAIPNAQWQPLPFAASAYSFAKINLPAGVSSFSLSADSAFNAIAYGFGDYESFAYSAGTNVKDLYRNVTIQNEFGVEGEPLSCSQTKFKVIVTYPYRTDKLTWKFGGVLPDRVLNNPVPFDSVNTNGRMIYKYKLDNEMQISVPGDYVFSIIANNPVFDNCQGDDEIEYNMQVLKRPNANFGITTTFCISDSVHFTDQSDTLGRTTAKWFWNFGDTLISNLLSPLHKYTNSGNYSVQRWFISDIGCTSDTAIKTVLLSDVPLAAFKFTPSVCQFTPVAFEDSSSISGSFFIKQWKWSFGDGTSLVTSNSSKPSHVYSKDTATEVSLQVVSSSGCNSSILKKPITINPKPVADFSVPVFCIPAANQFINKSKLKGQLSPNLSFKWNFGDSSLPDISINPFHSFTGKGPYNVTLTANTQFGCSSDTIKFVNSIYAREHLLVIAPAAVCFNDSAVLQINPVSQEGNKLNNIFYRPIVGASYTSISNGTAINMIRLPLSLTRDSSVVSITATTSTTGCPTDTVTKVVRINKLPVANIHIAYPLCENALIKFKDSSQSSDGEIVKWKWDFGNNTISALKDPILSFRKGIYTVSLSIETDRGCKATSLMSNFQINSLPVPDFIMPEICLTDGIAKFENKSSLNDTLNNSLIYRWSFGDVFSNTANPDTSHDINPTHKYSDTGFYKVKLSALSLNGCRSDTEKLFPVNGTKPKASISILDPLHLCGDKAVILQNESYVDFGGITRLDIFWDAEDSLQKETDQTPIKGKKYSHNYPVISAVDKIYNIRAIAYSGNTCLNQTDTTVIVRPVPQVNFNPLQSVCNNAQPFIIKEAGEITGLPGTGYYTGSTIQRNGLYDPRSAKPGIDTINYVFVSSNGCVSNKTQTIKVLQSPSANAGYDLFIGENEKIILNGYGEGNGLSFSWTPVLAISNPFIANPTVSPNRSIIYSLKVTSAEGCQSEDNVNVFVFSKLNIPNSFTPNNDGLNDTWRIPLIESYGGTIAVQIYNRNGQVVFSSQGYKKPWDGYFKGEPLGAGTFVYLIKFYNGKSPVSGLVNLIR